MLTNEHKYMREACGAIDEGAIGERRRALISRVYAAAARYDDEGRYEDLTLGTKSVPPTLKLWLLACGAGATAVTGLGTAPCTA